MPVVTEVVDESTDLAAVGMVAVVKGRERTGEHWNEIAEVTSYSATGAAIRIHHECHTGQVIALNLPVPAYLRNYDHDKEFYKVWALVQNCQPSKAGGQVEYFVGVAFIGKNPPAGFNANPSRSYRICGVSDEGFWKVEPLKSAFKSRKEVRYWQRFELYLAQVDTDRRTLAGARSVAENVSKGGAAVVTKLDVSVGDRVKFISEQYDYSGIAVVCDLQRDERGQNRIHIKFIDSAFPVDKLKDNGKEKRS